MVSVAAGIEDLDAAAAEPLGLVQRHIGVVQQVLRGDVGTVVDADADGRAELEAAALEHEGRGQRAQHPGRDLTGFELAGVLAQDGELVAAEARERVARADRLRQAPRRLAQHGVTGGVAHGVVDELEAIEIDEQDGESAGL